MIELNLQNYFLAFSKTATNRTVYSTSYISYTTIYFIIKLPAGKFIHFLTKRSHKPLFITQQNTVGSCLHQAHSPQLQVSTMRIFSATFKWCPHFVCLISVPRLTHKPVLYRRMQGSSPHSLENQLSHQLQTKSCGDRHPPHFSGIGAQPLASGNKQQRPQAHRHHEEDLFAVLVSRCWLTSFPGRRLCRQPLCPGKWSMHNSLASQDRYHQLFLFADPLERG